MERTASTMMRPTANHAQQVSDCACATVAGKPLSIRSGFEALSFKHAMFGGLMDPLVMVDHYIMTEPTFCAHPHAGMSAVTVLFEDSQLAFNNRDSLGNNIDLMPGDLYWLKAGSGAVHDESPVSGATAHGLQMFVNLPARMKHDAPQALHVKAGNMPSIEINGVKVRIVLGESNGVRGASSPALPVTILDVKLDAGSHFEHDVAPGHSQWIYAVHGRIEAAVENEGVTIPKGEALAIKALPKAQKLDVRAQVDSHAVIVTGEPIAETFVQRGPFVMSNQAAIAEVEAAYRAGRFGKLDD
jgi:redox-sensitive bicupin YhaK (pirin superfamily)